MKYINKQRLLIVLTLTFLFSLSITYARTAATNISNSVFRLHVVANSDSAKDQELKLLVRDRLLKESQHLFKSSTSAKHCAEIAKEHLSELCRIAKNEVSECGFDYEVTGAVGSFDFPVKSYGNITLPGGKYTALRIEIGKAEGKNWWCVMYPPLCLADGIVSYNKDAELQLKNSLTKQEYSLITNQSQNSIPVEIRFKIWEILQKVFRELS